MPEQISNNKRIAKNTMILYFRMGITLIVSLYTSRVILAALGVEDYGIYTLKVYAENKKYRRVLEED